MSSRYSSATSVFPTYRMQRCARTLNKLPYIFCVSIPSKVWSGNTDLSDWKVCQHGAIVWDVGKMPVIVKVNLHVQCHAAGNTVCKHCQQFMAHPSCKNWLDWSLKYSGPLPLQCVQLPVSSLVASFPPGLKKTKQNTTHQYGIVLKLYFCNHVTREYDSQVVICHFYGILH